MSTAVSSHSGAGPLSLMSCVRESSPQQDGITEYEVEKNPSSKKKFWNPRKWFKRKSNKVSEKVITSIDASEPKETLRSRSTSELSVSEEQTRRRSGTPMHPGLSVSHDSVFHSPHSGSELELDATQSSSSLSISHQPTQHDIRLQTELSERLRLRRNRGDTSEDDEGLPRSPCNLPATADGLFDKSSNKDHPTKSHSTCSDGSLLSMGSSEMDEESFGQQSRHSSKLSLHERRPQECTEIEMEWGPGYSSAPLNHSAAHHKVSVRPKRTHAAPRRKRVPVPGSALPTTPEVNEDSSVRSVSPDPTRETITELYTSMNHHTQTVSNQKIKCSSLPPGLAGPGTDGNKLSRSRSNGGSKSQDPLEEEESTEGKKPESSFFGRIFPRRSGKKKKVKEEKREENTMVNIISNVSSYTSRTENNFSSININYEPFDKNMITVDHNLAIRPNALRSGPASRQRMQPIDIPASPELNRQQGVISQPSSPVHTQIETHIKHRIFTTAGSSLLKFSQNSPPQVSNPLNISISPPKSPWSDRRHYTKSSTKFLETTREESKSRVRIAGLSSLQQRVLSLNDDTDNSFKSLTNLPTDYEKPVRPVAKSHSFKTTKSNYEQKDTRHTFIETSSFKTNEMIADKKDVCIFKSISLDSVKNINENIVESINEAKVESQDFVSLRIPEVLRDYADVKATEESTVTISGPSHKAIVNIGSTDSQVVITKSNEADIKEQQISVTKIQLKHENSQVTVSKNSVPEFFNFQLNKVDEKPLAAASISPKNLEENSKFEEEISILSTPKKFKTPEEENPEMLDKQRKFSNDNIELVKKDDTKSPVKANPLVTVTPMGNANNRFYKKHLESMRKMSASEKPTLKIKSNSFEATEPKRCGESSSSSNKSSQSSLEKIETKSPEHVPENAVLRRKSLIRQKTDDEPELMKVFARRSLKLKDTDSEVLSQQVVLMVKESENTSKSRDSDKENLFDSSPPEERKKPLIRDAKIQKDVKIQKDIKTQKDAKIIKEPLMESKFVESTEVTLRKPVVNNKFCLYQRTVSLNTTKPEPKVLKTISVVDRPKTETWYLNKGQEDDKEAIEADEIITNVSDKTEIIHDFNVKPKNFNQRKAEWEKRAQEALRKTLP